MAENASVTTVVRTASMGVIVRMATWECFVISGAVSLLPRWTASGRRWFHWHKRCTVTWNNFNFFAGEGRCLNGGTCSNDYGYCLCPFGYSGQFCEISELGVALEIIHHLTMFTYMTSLHSTLTVSPNTMYCIVLAMWIQMRCKIVVTCCQSCCHDVAMVITVIPCCTYYWNTWQWHFEGATVAVHCCKK